MSSAATNDIESFVSQAENVGEEETMLTLLEYISPSYLLFTPPSLLDFTPLPFRQSSRQSHRNRIRLSITSTSLDNRKHVEATEGRSEGQGFDDGVS